MLALALKEQESFCSYCDPYYFQNFFFFWIYCAELFTSSNWIFRHWNSRWVHKIWRWVWGQIRI